MGVSALVRIPKARNSSAHSISVPKLPVSSGSIRSTLPKITSPVVPFRVIQSPSLRMVPLILTSRLASLILASPHPATQHLPIPRATTAACEVIPPRAVKIPSAASIPPISSGEVSLRTKITCSPRSFQASASSALKTMRPIAAPGDAGRPLAITFTSAFGSICLCSSWSNCSGSTRITAVFLSIRPSSTISTAILTAA